MLSDPSLSNLIPASINNATQFADFISKIGLTWHHSEKLGKMILIDRRIHNGINHWDSVVLITKFLSENPHLRGVYTSIMNTLS